MYDVAGTVIALVVVCSLAAGILFLIDQVRVCGGGLSQDERNTIVEPRTERWQTSMGSLFSEHGRQYRWL